MKLVITFLVAGLLHVEANTIAQNVSIKGKNISLGLVFKKIEKQTSYVFFYDESLMKISQPVTVALSDVTLEEALIKVFAEQPLNYKIVGTTVTIMKKRDIRDRFFETKEILIPQVIIKGKITNENGAPLEGASVTIKGTRIGVTSNQSGDFAINAEINQVLVFSYTGMKSREVRITDVSKPINVSLELNESAMEDVVIMGVRTVKQESFTGASISVSGEDIRRVGNQNLFQSLKNLDPTVNIMENLTMGSDPNSLPELNMRGGTSFSEDIGSSNLKGNYQNKPNQPLFILDGFETSIERVFDLDMNTVESLTVLKDASAKALYGSKAANGVVVIESKRLSGSKPRIFYNGSLDLTMPDLSSYDLLDGLEKLDVEYREGVYLDNPSSMANYYKLRKQVMEGVNTYWLSKPVQMGYGQKHSLNVELGARELRTNIDLSLYENEGVMKGSGRKTLTGRFALLYNLNKLKFQNRLSLVNNKADDSPYGTFSTYTLLNPYLNPYDEFGNLTTTMLPGNVRNPLKDAEIPTSLKSGYFEFVNNFQVEYAFNSEFILRGRMSIEKKNNDARRFYPATHTKFASYSNDIAYRKGQYEANYGHNDKILADLYLNYSKTIKSDHNVFLTGGFNLAETKYREEVHYAEGFPSDFMNDIMFAYQYNASMARPSGITGHLREFGVLSMLSYSYKNRFLFDGTFRMNASSVFGNENLFAPFWSVGLGWNLHKEKFLEDIASLRLLKIRGSVGSTGNQNFLNNKSLTVNNYYLSDRYAGLIGSYAGNMENPELKWESKMDYDVGIDADIAGFNFRFDLYKSLTKNLVTSISTAPSTGFASVSENLGLVENKGLEVSLAYTVFQNKNGFLRLNGAYTINENTILKISDAMRTFNDNQLKKINNRDSISYNTRTVILYYDGLPMNTIWAVPSYGIDPATGIELLKGRNGEPTYTWKASDMVPSGISVPKWRGNFGVNGEYKGIGVGVIFTYLGGGQYYNQTLADKIENINITQNFDRRVLTERWMEPGMEVQFKRNVGATPYDMRNGLYFYSGSSWRQELTRPTQRFVQNLNDLNISSVTLSYDFPRKLISKWRMERLKLSAYMNDLAKFSTIGIERGTTYPFARTVSFKLSVTF